MAEFSKAIDILLILKLRNEPLFQSWLDEETLTDCLLEDMLNGEVFATIWAGCVYFYYQGKMLFAYDGTFKACLAKAFVPQYDGFEHIEMMDETELAGMKHHVDFRDAYEKIKMRFLFWEDTDVSARFYPFSFAAYPCEQYFVLDTRIEWDTEIQVVVPHCFLLMDAHAGRLLFCAAMKYSGMEGPLEYDVKELTYQLERYRDRIAEQRDDIIEQYGQYTRAMEALTGIGLPAPTGVCGDCGLLIYGFDEDQQNGKLKKITDSLTEMGWSVCAVRDIEDVTPETLFTRLARGV